MQKGFSPILIVILIVAAIGGYFIYQNQPKPTPIVQQTPQPSPTPIDETANWKTYTNSIYKFHFDYPQEWNFNVPSLESKHPSNKSVLIVNITSDPDFKNKALLENQKNILLITLDVWDKGTQTLTLGLAEWDKFLQNHPPDTKSTKSINNITWIVRDLTNVSNLPIREYITEKGNYLYIFTIGPRDSTLIDLANQTLSTFKFLETSNGNSNLQKACEEKEGTWLEEYRECESVATDKGIDQNECVNLGGKFEKCDSACRHLPQEMIVCKSACIKVCKFN